MFLNIIKKDLKRKKSMNAILFVFIVLCGTFMASSVGNMLTIVNAINYFEKQTNVSDYFIFKNGENADEFEEWLESNRYADDYQKETGILVNSENVSLPNGKYETIGGTILNMLPEKYNLVLDSDDRPLTFIKKGEIAMTVYDADRVDARIGDKITVTLDGRERSFTLSYIVKDMIYGTQYIDNNRFLINAEDYNYFYSTDTTGVINLYSVKSNDIASFGRELHKQDFHIYYDIDKAAINMIFTMDMVVASILIVVSVCLIIISLVILRFTIVFTLQDDYREIGVMKAIGLFPSYIKRIYIVKYFALSLLGSAVGTFLSIPFGNMMIENLKKNIAMESAGNPLISVLCGVAIILIVMLFCWLSTGSVDRFTVIQAIRNGSTGERFRSKRFLYLNKRGKIPVSLFMSLNSILSALKSYSVLLITFILGTMLVILPLNAVNTLSSPNIIELFGFSKSDAYIDNAKTADYTANGTEYMMNDIDNLRRLYRENGIDAVINPVSINLVQFYVENPDDGINVLSFKSYVYEASAYKAFIDGTPPLLPNEIAVTEKVLEKTNIKIGDSVYIKIGGSAEKYLITASFQSMNNMGDSMFFATSADIDIKNSNGFNLLCDFTNRDDIEGQIKKISEITPEYKIQTAIEMTDTYVGSISDTIDSMKSMLLCVVLFINCLITVLLMRTFITKEKGEISLLKNIGCRNRFISLWQAMRIMITLFISVTAGSLLSNAFNGIMAKYTFGLMGAANVAIKVVPFEVYFLYPLIIFAGTSIAAVVSTLAVRKISFREINNVE